MQHPWQVRALLVLKLLRIPSSALCPTRQVGTDTARRWQRFVLFFDSSEAEQRLKKVCLCLLMTDVALAIAAKKHDKRQGQEPTILRLSRGDVQLAASKQLQAILANMHVDRDIDASDVLTGLLTTHGHLTVRFLDFAQWPFRILTLSQKYNPDAYVSAIEGFLDSVSAELDAGFSRPLQADALRQGSLADAISFLLSDSIQSYVDQTLHIISASSLDVERKHAQDKKQEKCRVLSVAAASRNSVLQRYCTSRQSAITATFQTRKRARKNLKISSTTLAVQRNPTWLPRPAGFMGAQYSHPGRPDDLQKYIEANRAELEASAAALRREASAALAVQDMPILPKTNADWLRFLEARRDDFRALLKSATAERRSLSARHAGMVGAVCSCLYIFSILGSVGLMLCMESTFSLVGSVGLMLVMESTLSPVEGGEQAGRAFGFRLEFKP